MRNDQLLKIAAYSFNESNFYNNLLGSAPTCYEEFLRIPLLEANMLLKYLPPQGEGLLTRDLQKCYTFATSGTTGKRKYIYRSFEETKQSSELFSKGLSCVLNDKDRVANLLYYGEMWAAPITVGKALERLSSTVFTIGGNADNSTVLEFLDLFSINSVICVPSQAVSLAHYVKSNNVVGISLKNLITGGEHLYKRMSDYISSILDIENFHSVGYAINEVGPIGYQCPFTDKNEYHIHEDHVYVEVLDIKSKEPVPLEQQGSIVVSNLYFKLMPILRYVTGDIGSLHEYECQCGFKGKSLLLGGRSDNRFKFGDDFMSVKEIEKLLHDVVENSFSYCIVVDNSNAFDQLIIQLEIHQNISLLQQHDLKRDILSGILNLSLLKYQVDRNQVALPKIQVLKFGELDRNPSTGKVVNFVDNRIIN